MSNRSLLTLEDVHARIQGSRPHLGRARSLGRRRSALVLFVDLYDFPMNLKDPENLSALLIGDPSGSANATAPPSPPLLNIDCWQITLDRMAYVSSI